MDGSFSVNSLGAFDSFFMGGRSGGALGGGGSTKSTFIGGGLFFGGNGAGGKLSAIDADAFGLGNGGIFDSSIADGFTSGTGSSARTRVISDAGFAIGRSTAGGGGMSTAATFESGAGKGGSLFVSAFVIGISIEGGLRSGS
jgi:hypothetical protein